MPTIREDLRPGSPKAQKLRKKIRESIDMSYKHISQQFNVWDDIEETYRAFRSTDDADRESLEKHGVTKIIVPIQFAAVQVMLTFMMEVFTAMKPVLRVRGGDPASVRPARVMEFLLDHDYRNNRGYLMLQQWFLNTFRYGYGIIENSWGTRTTLKRILKRQPSVGKIILEGQEFDVPGGLEYDKDYLVTFEGNLWQVSDNRSWFWDPRVTLTNFQQGEFCGRRSTIHSNELRKLEDSDIFFNTSLVKTSRGSLRDTESSIEDNKRSRLPAMQALMSEIADAHRNKVHVNEQIIIELIPKDYELSEEDRPEQWIFNLVNDEVIVRAEPSPFNCFNYSVCEAFPDILASVSQGVMELSDPLSRHLSFLFNSHMANVRKAINDMLVIDPSRIDINDLLNPNAGKLVRSLPQAYGLDPSTAVKQLVVQDITRGHIEDSRMIIELGREILGVSPHMFGSIAQGRRTALEMQGVFKQTGSRMKMLADLMSCEGVAPLTEQMARLRQENMSIEQFVEIVGKTAADLGVGPDDVIDNFLRARRDHVQGRFYFPAEEGVLPQDRAMAAQVLQKVFETVARAPFLAQAFNPVEIFKETIRQYGIHNIDDFLNKTGRGEVQVLPNDQVNDLRAKGRVRPVGVGGRPNDGVRESVEGLTLEGAMHGAGRPRD